MKKKNGLTLGLQKYNNNRFRFSYLYIAEHNWHNPDLITIDHCQSCNFELFHSPRWNTEGNHLAHFQRQWGRYIKSLLSLHFWLHAQLQTYRLGELHGIWVTFTFQILFPSRVPEVKVRVEGAEVPWGPASKYTRDEGNPFKSKIFLRFFLAGSISSPSLIGLLCCPVFKPHISGGSDAAGVDTVKPSPSSKEQTPFPSETWVSNVRKSSRNWHTSDGWTRNEMEKRWHVMAW